MQGKVAPTCFHWGAAAASQRADDLCIHSVPVPLSSQFAEALSTWNLDTDDLIGRLIWAQTEAESRANKARKYKAYTFMIMNRKFKNAFLS